MIKRATAFAPATVANVAVGFDILGFALAGIGETAVLERLEGSPEVIVEPVAGYAEIPTDPQKNTATAGLLRLIRERSLRFGFRVKLQKSIPIGSGLGGSSTSAVAAIVAANALLPKKLALAELLDFAMTGEEVASGSRHGDNVGPSLYGGLVLVRSRPQQEVIKIKTPTALRCVVVLPALKIHTREARGILQPEIKLNLFIEQSANLAGFLLGCARADFSLMRNSLRDVLIEPQRAGLIPGFYELQKVALAAGALGFSISGSGPAMFALCSSQAAAVRVRKALVHKAQELALPLAGHWLSPIAAKGAGLLRRVR